MIQLAAGYSSDVPARKPEWILLPKAAERAGKHVQTIRRWIRLGSVKTRPSAPGLPRGTFVDYADIRRILEEGVPAQDD